MFARKETPSPTLSERSAKDGRHCDLCGSPSPAVRCEKCGGHCFCLSCDDMYHRHPKRKSHQRKATECLPPGAGAAGTRRPLAAPGDPSKMPIPPPRKKKGKSIFARLSGSSGGEKVPALPKKEFSFSEKLGSIRSFMSNRPLPPIPRDQDMVPAPTTRRSQSPRGPPAMMLERAPQSPKHKPPSEDRFSSHRPTSPQYQNILSHLTKLAQSSCEEWEEEPSTSGSTRGSSGAEDGGSGGGWGQLEARPGRQVRSPPPLYPPRRGQQPPQQTSADEWSGVGTLRRGQAAFMQPSRDLPSRGMQLSTSATDLTELTLAPPQQQHPQGGPIPGYPYLYPPGVPPLFPHFAPAQSMGRLNYPYYGGSWTNLKNKGTRGTDADEENEDEEEEEGKRSTLTRRRHSESKMKRSQSVMYDPSMMPGPYFPFGAMPPPGYPSFIAPGAGGYPYWGMPGAPLQTPPSPSASVRSLTRSQDRRQQRSRRQAEDGGSSASSYGGGGGSGGRTGTGRARRKPEDTDRDLSSEEEPMEVDRGHPGDLAQQNNPRNPADHRNPGQQGNPGDHGNPGHHKNPGDHGNPADRKEPGNPSNPGSKSQEAKDGRPASVAEGSEKPHNPGPGVAPATSWECEFCTFINDAGSRICSICCKSISTPHREDLAEDSVEPKKDIVVTELSEEVLKEQEQIEKEIRRQIEVKQKLSEESPGVLASQTSSTFTTEENEPKTEEPSVLSPTLSAGRISPIPSSEDAKPAPGAVADKIGVEIETQTEQAVVASTNVDINLADSVVPEAKLIPVQLERADASPVGTAPMDEEVKPCAPTKADSSCQTNGDLPKLGVSVRPKTTTAGSSQATEDIQIVVPAQRGRQVEMGTSPPPQDFFTQTPFDEVEHQERRPRIAPIQRSLSQTSLNADREYRRKGHQDDGFGQLIRSLSRGSLASEPGGGGVGGYSAGQSSGRGTRNHPSAFAPVGSGPRGMYTSDWNLHRRTDWDDQDGRFTRPNTAGQWQSGGNLNLRKPEYFLEELAERKRQEKMRTQGLEMVRMIRKAEQQGFVPDDLQVATANCGDQDPVDWLEENWRNMIETVVTLATNYGHDKPDNDVGIVSAGEARSALRMHRGNIWAAVTECVEARQKKYLEIQKRGDFTRREIITALTAQQGDTELAYEDLLLQGRDPRNRAPGSPGPAEQVVAEESLPAQTARSRFFGLREPAEQPWSARKAEFRRSSLVESFGPEAFPSRNDGRRFSYSASLSNEPRHLSPGSYFQPPSADISDSQSFASDDLEPAVDEPFQDQEVKRDRLSWIKSKRTAQKEIKRSTSFLDKLAALRKDKKPEERKPNESKFLRYGSLNVLDIDMSGLRQASFEEYMKDIESKPEDQAQRAPKQGLLSRLFSRGSSTDVRAPKSEFYAQADGQQQIFDYPVGRMTQEYPVMKDSTTLNQFLSEASAIEKVQAYLNQIPGNQVSPPPQATVPREPYVSASPQTIPTQMSFSQQNPQFNNMLQQLGIFPQLISGFESTVKSEPLPEQVNLQAASGPVTGQYQPFPVAFSQATGASGFPSQQPTLATQSQEPKEKVNNNNLKAQWLGVKLDAPSDADSKVSHAVQQDARVASDQKAVGKTNQQTQGSNNKKRDQLLDLVTEEILPIPTVEEVKIASDTPEFVKEQVQQQYTTVPEKVPPTEILNAEIKTISTMLSVDFETVEYEPDSKDPMRDDSLITSSRPLGVATNAVSVTQPVQPRPMNQDRVQDAAEPYCLESPLSSTMPLSIMPLSSTPQLTMPQLPMPLSSTPQLTMPLSESKTSDTPPEVKPRLGNKRKTKVAPVSMPQSKTETSIVDEIKKIDVLSSTSSEFTADLSSFEAFELTSETANIEPNVMKMSEPQLTLDSAQKEEKYPFIVDELDSKFVASRPEVQTLSVPQASNVDDLSSSISDSVPEADDADVESASYTDGDSTEIGLEDYVQAIVLDNIKVESPVKEPSPERPLIVEPPHEEEVKEEPRGGIRRRRRSVSRERNSKAGSIPEAIKSVDDLLPEPEIATETEPIPLPVAISSKGARRQRSISRDRRVALAKEPTEAAKEPAFLRRRSSAKENRLDTSLALVSSEPVVKAEPSEVRRKSLKDTKKAGASESRIDKYKKKVPEKAKVPEVQNQLGPVMSAKRLAFDNRVKELLSRDTCATYEQAEMAARLMEMNFLEAEALQAAKECGSLYQAISYLQQDCELCAGKFPVAEMLSMLHCTHRACRDCLNAYFSIQIRDRNILELLCPFCSEPDLTDDDKASEYFNHMDLMLKNLVEPDIHELFHRKLRDRALMKDPNFRWCSQCSSGFIINNPNQKRLLCPDCKAVTCASCRKLWEKQHEGISCQQFQEWKEANDPELQAAGLAQHLAENGIDCPNCHFRYSLAKGGCMHFRCLQCQYDFCSGCSKPFKMGQKCGVSDFCAKLGLHAHHPRNCLFYLRDKEPTDLQKLLDEFQVPYNKNPPPGSDVRKVCQVMEQKEMPSGLTDDVCGKDVLEGYGGLCRVHYTEYLGSLITKNNVDPLTIFNEDELELVLKRASIKLPYRFYRTKDSDYRARLIEVILAEMPLEKIEGS